MQENLKDFVRDAKIVEELLNPRNRLIMVIGSSDTGKTSLVRCIASHLATETLVGIVDVDLGQSHVGPPTAVAWGKVEGGFKHWNAVRVKGFYFVGSLTPKGNLLSTVVGTKLMTERALAACPKVVVDTTGFVAGGGGRVLKHAKIDILCPDVLLALERSDELQHILGCLRLQESPRLWRLRVPESVQLKDYFTRSRYRLKRFRSYFNGARVVRVSLDDVGMRPVREPAGEPFGDLGGRIVSFRDAENRDLALGIVEGLNIQDKKLLIRSPLKRGLKFTSIVIGEAKVSL